VGHAYDCRIKAEYPQLNCAPAAGRLTNVVFPGGPAIPVDTPGFGGSVVPPGYDAMIAKSVAVAATREAAIARMERALRETVIEGVKTTVTQCLDILDNERFKAGTYDIDFLPSLLRASNGVPQPAGHAS